MAAVVVLVAVFVVDVVFVVVVVVAVAVAVISSRLFTGLFSHEGADTLENGSEGANGSAISRAICLREELLEGFLFVSFLIFAMDRDSVGV